MVERTTIRLPDELLRRAKRKAAGEGRTLTALIEDGLRQVVAEDRMKEKLERRLPRVSKASGGLQPGIDLLDLHAQQEADDRDYIAGAKRPT